MIYRFHRKPPISQGMTTQPKNLHISGKRVGQLFVGKCTDVIWECSKIQRWVIFFFCDVFLQTHCFHRNSGLICRNMGCTSYDVQHATMHAFPLTHQVFQAAAHSLMKGMSLCILRSFIPALETSPNFTPTKANTSVCTAGQILPWIWARRMIFFKKKKRKADVLTRFFKYAVPEYTRL